MHKLTILKAFRDKNLTYLYKDYKHQVTELDTNLKNAKKVRIKYAGITTEVSLDDPYLKVFGVTMDIIKFKVMRGKTPVAYEWLDDGNWKHTVLIDKKGLESKEHFGVSNFPRCLRLRFTGLHSVKGKRGLIGVEIYEGDVFREEKDTKDGRPIFINKVVMWIKQRGAFYLVDSAHYHTLTDNDCSQEDEFDWLFEEAALYDFSLDVGLTMIGNIHENKDLLK